MHASATTTTAATAEPFSLRRTIFIWRCTFTATTTSTGDVVTVSMQVAFPGAADGEISGDAQGAFTVLDNNGTLTFAVLVKENDEYAWRNVTGVTPVAGTPYDIAIKFDYGAMKYSVIVGGTALSDGTTTLFDILTTAKTVKTVDFKGTGSLSYLKGDTVEGNMVEDANGVKYATIDAAITAYNANPAIGPLRLLHAGTAPTGWKIVEQDGWQYLKRDVRGVLILTF